MTIEKARGIRAFFLVSFNDEDIIFDPFDLLLAVDAFEGRGQRHVKMNETAVNTLEAAVGFDRIDGAEDIFGANCEDHPLSVVLARVNNPDYLSVIIEHGGAAIPGICCDCQLKGGSVFPMAGCSAKIPFVVNNLGARVT